MTVNIPSPLRSYTGSASTEAQGSTVAEVVRDLDARFPGMRFRMVDEQGGIRPHVRFFVNGELAALDTRVSAADQLDVICALSGG
jgi:molybdopterin converting factor small subunit